jgi:chemotaxis signal transduction protein
VPESGVTDAGKAAERLLRERARALARPRRTAALVADDQFLLFELAGERYAIEAARAFAVAPVRNLSALPGSVAGVRGLIAWRGRLVPALDLRAGLGLPGGGADDLRYVIVMGENRASVAVLAAQVSEVVAMPRTAFGAAPGADRNDLILGLAADGTILIDAARLLRRYV